MAQAIRSVAREQTPRTPPSPRKIFAFAIVLMVLVAVGYVLQSLVGSGTHPIRQVSVEGDFKYLTPNYIQTLVADDVRGGFFAVNVQRIRARLLDEPWIFDASVERQWPDVLHVAIIEQVPSARWGAHALLNREADVYAPSLSSIPNGLPQLNGPIGSEAEVLARYRTMSTQLKPLQLDIAAVTLSDRGAWTLLLRDKTELIIGQNDIERRVSRFIASFESWLKPQWSNIAAVDLRYTNGFAVRERVVTPPAVPDKQS